MTTAMRAAVFARHGGGSVLAWDNNDTRGTLGWRTETGPHDATVQDLLPETSRLLEPAAGIGEIAGFVHHQTRSGEHTSELKSLMRNSYAVFGLKKNKNNKRR